MRVSSDMPDDVIVLHDALTRLREYSQESRVKSREPLVLNLKNCGTALRFLEVHLEKCYPGEPITLTGDARLMERKGKPTSQTTSARILHGEDIPVEEGESPYITMTREVVKAYPNVQMEVDWSSAAFWYEYVATHNGELFLEGLQCFSIQGDRVVGKLFEQYFGVTSSFVKEGVFIKKSSIFTSPSSITIDFTNCPDLFPAIALTCEKLGISLEAKGTEQLQYKESDRLEAVRLHEVRDDHRMAMALMASGAYPLPLPKGKGAEMQRIIAKSYPEFVEQLSTVRIQSTEYRIQKIAHITPIKGVNDDNLGKKHALSKLIHTAEAEYVWLHDDDVVLPEAAKTRVESQESRVKSLDLIILPLRMESLSERPSLLEKLQIAEYAAIQELTMRSAKKEQAVMCSGANMIVRREAWLDCEGDLHFEIPSGDDMFLLEAMKKRGYKVGVIDEEDYTAIVRPITSWKAFFRQRMRWAGKAPKYTDKDIIRCGAIVATANILQFLCPPILLIKFPIEYSLIRSRQQSVISNQSSNIHHKTTWYIALLLEIVYPIYLLICLIGGICNKKEW